MKGLSRAERGRGWWKEWVKFCGGRSEHKHPHGPSTPHPKLHTYVPTTTATVPTRLPCLPIKGHPLDIPTPYRFNSKTLNLKPPTLGPAPPTRKHGCPEGAQLGALEALHQRHSHSAHPQHCGHTQVPHSPLAHTPAGRQVELTGETPHPCKRQSSQGPACLAEPCQASPCWCRWWWWW